MNYVSVKLVALKGPKFDAIKAIRYYSRGLDLTLAKALCESLPQQVSIEVKEYDEVAKHFEIEPVDAFAASPEVLRERWGALSLDRQTILLQYLASLNMLKE